MSAPCKHPKVRVVAREEDVEYVECQECGEVFDSDEFRDMAIEETQELEEETCSLRRRSERLQPLAGVPEKLRRRVICHA